MQLLRFAWKNRRCIPHSVSRSLTALHLASNRLNQLPDSICRLKTLKVLWLDHNFIAGGLQTPHAVLVLCPPFSLGPNAHHRSLQYNPKDHFFESSFEMVAINDARQTQSQLLELATNDSGSGDRQRVHSWRVICLDS